MDTKTFISRMPETPGVYLMHDADGTIIYVGKSKKLRARVSSYFVAGADLSPAKRSMVKQVQDIEYIETGSEIEALVLETNLIKLHTPKYNILMKDDKNLSYIHLTGDPVPELRRVRSRPTSGTCFGPYATDTDISEALTVLRRIFRIRACRVEFLKRSNGELAIGHKAGRSIPCMDHYIGLCPAPCLLTDETLAEHAEHVKAFITYMRGRRGDIISELTDRMRQAAQNLEYEEAGKIKRQIDTLKRLGVRQIARDAIPGDHRIIFYLEKYEKIYVGVTEVADGEIRGVRTTEIVPRLGETRSEIVSLVIMEGLLAEDDRPLQSIILDHPIDDADTLAYLHTRGIEVSVSATGVRRELLEFTERQVVEAAYRRRMASLSDRTLSRGTMASILSSLGYPAPKSWPITFECYDISHTSGMHTVASRSVLVNGKPTSDRYRKYKIKTLKEGEIDDYRSIREVILRRAKEALTSTPWPTLVLIDGGKGQLASAREAIEMVYEQAENEGMSDIPPRPHLASLAKREEEIFIPGEPEPILFEKGSAELMALQKVRDEAHRFAIMYGRERRSTAMKKNILEELPGIGPKTRKKLLTRAGSLDGVREIPRDELLTILTKAQVKTLEDHGFL